MEPFSVRRNNLDFTAVRLHYRADPDKNPDTETGQKWHEQARRLYPDPNQWQMEFEISWWVAEGQRVYPEFTESLHAKPLSLRPRKVIYRAWDFGWLAPACLIAQIDEKDRLVILHEVVGHQETTREFARHVIDRCAQWFPAHAPGYEDFCDPAGQQASPTASEHSEVRDVEVLSALSIWPKWDHSWSRKDGRALVHQLLAPRTDGTPSCYVDTAECPILLQGFLGKYVFPESRTGKIQDEPDETNHPWADAHACLRYLATGLYSTLGLRRFRYMPVMKTDEPSYHGYGSPMRTAHA